MSSQLIFHVAPAEDDRMHVQRIDNAGTTVSLRDISQKKYSACLIGLFGDIKLWTSRHDPTTNMFVFRRQGARAEAVLAQARNLVDDRSRSWRKDALQPLPGLMGRPEAVEYSIQHDIDEGLDGVKGYFVLENGKPQFNPALRADDILFVHATANKELSLDELSELVESQYRESPSDIVRHNLSYRVKVFRKRPSSAETQAPIDEKLPGTTLDPCFAGDKFNFFLADLRFERLVSDLQDGVLVGLEVVETMGQSFKDKVFYREVVELGGGADWEHFHDLMLPIMSMTDPLEMHKLLTRGFDFQMTINDQPVSVDDVSRGRGSYRLKLALPPKCRTANGLCQFHIRTIGAFPKTVHYFPFYISEATRNVQFQFECASAGLNLLTHFTFLNSAVPDQIREQVFKRQINVDHEGLVQPGEGCIVMWSPSP